MGEEVDMPTEYGHFRLIPFRQASNGLEHMALIKGEWKEDEPILVRVHSSCATGDILGSKRCDCGQQLHKAMQAIEKAGKGVVIYMQQEGRGIGLMNKIAAYKLQEEGYDTVDANTHFGFKPDERDYGCGAQMLRHLGVHKMRLLTNNPTKRVGLESYGLEIVENVPIEVIPNEYNERYLMADKDLTKPTEIEFCTGSFSAVDTAVFKAVGGFDEDYFMYVEDADLTQKMRTRGKAYLVPQYTAIHAWHRAAHRSLKPFLWQLRSLLRYFSKWGFAW